MYIPLFRLLIFLLLISDLCLILEEFSSCSWTDGDIGFFVPDIIPDSHQVPCFFLPLGP